MVGTSVRRAHVFLPGCIALASDSALYAFPEMASTGDPRAEASAADAPNGSQIARSVRSKGRRRFSGSIANRAGAQLPITAMEIQELGSRAMAPPAGPIPSVCPSGSTVRQPARQR